MAGADAADTAAADVGGEAEKTPTSPVAAVGWHHEYGFCLLGRRDCF